MVKDMQILCDAAQFYSKSAVTLEVGGFIPPGSQRSEGQIGRSLCCFCSITCFVRSHGRPNLLVFLAASATLVYLRAGLRGWVAQLVFGQPGPRAHSGRAAG